MRDSNQSFEQKSRLLGRLLVVMAVASCWVLVILGRLIFLQGFQSEQYNLQAETQQWGYVDLSPKRGDILDRHLEELAISVRADTVYAHPHQIRDVLRCADALSEFLEIPQEALVEKLESDSPFVYLKRKIPPKTTQKIRELKLPGVYIQRETKRIYPNRELAAHVLGFVGDDNLGLGGLEYHYCKELRGEKGRIDLRFDAHRNSFTRKSSGSQVEGNMLVLSLDRNIQHVTEKVLRETVQDKQARSGSALVLDPNTGAVLAMASYPSFNPNDFKEYSPAERRNRTILDVYEPGSTFKVVTMASLLNEGLAAPDEVIDCRSGTARLAGKVYREAKTSFGFLTLTQVIAKSSNIGTVKLSLRLGEEPFHHYISGFGFGRETGIDLPGEEKGLFRPVSEWSKISIGALSIGQEIGVTPLQMIRAVAAIANGGYLVRPYVVQKILSPQGDLLFEHTPSRERILRREATDIGKQILRTVVLEGTGRTAQLKGYSSAGKTGTAQKIVDGRYSKSKYVASFVGFAPVENPRLIGLVVVEEPKGLPWGGHVAGPAFKKIMEHALINMEVPQDLPYAIDPEPGPNRSLASKKAEPRAHAEPEASYDVSVSEEGLSAQGLKEAVLAVVEGQPESEHTRSVTIELGSKALPDFTGMNLREVAQLCARLNIQLRISGSGKAVAQRPAPGRPVTKNLVCEVFFSNDGKSGNAASQLALRDLKVDGAEPTRQQR